MTERNHKHAHPHHANHGHGDHRHEHGEPDRRLLWVFLMTVSYMIAEAFGGAVTGSLALLADAGHMAVDAVAIGLALLAAKLARKAATSEKTFGYHRSETLAAFVNSASLIVVSGSIFYEAVHRVFDPRPIEGFGMFVVAIGGLAVNLISMRLLHAHHEHDLNSHGAWLHVVGDMLGSVGAVIAGVLIVTTGRVEIDAAVSVLIGAIIVAGSFGLLRRATHILLNGVPRNLDLVEIDESIRSTPGVNGVHDLHVWAISTGHNALTCHVVHDDFSDPGVLLGLMRRMIENRFGISHSTVQMEPQARDSDSGRACSVVGCYSMEAVS